LEKLEKEKRGELRMRRRKKRIQYGLIFKTFPYLS
jgi:hypothetical protein